MTDETPPADAPAEPVAPADPPAERPLAAAVPDTVAWNYKVVPLGRQDGRLLLGTAQPGLRTDAEAAVRACGEAELSFVTIPEAQFMTLFASLYPASLFATPQVPAPRRPELMGLGERAYLNWYARMGPLERALTLVLGVLVLAILVLYGRVLILGVIVLGRLLMTPVGLLLLFAAGAYLAWRILFRRP